MLPRSRSLRSVRPPVLAILALALAIPAARAQDPDIDEETGFDLAKLPPAATRPIDFAADVAPILESRCLSCHGPAKQRAGVAFHVKQRAMAGGDSGEVVIPGDGRRSRIVHLAAGFEPDLLMPPPDAGPPLSPEQIGVLIAWIDQGATWPDNLRLGSPADAESPRNAHWAFKAPVRPEIPQDPFAGTPLASDHPVDRFVRERLAREGLQPSPEADRATLARRLHLDLLGLPPTLDELDAYLDDPRPDDVAYEAMLDRILDSPHYGERWARFWLDRARYADTNGYEKDRERPVWPYRDWVVRAFNSDMPFDRFTIEQIAGDMLPDPTPDQRVATGFHRNTMTNEEGGIDVEEFRYAAIVDRVATTGTVWLGLTLGCAQCHTHKYDPLTQREYYGVFAFLDNADEPEFPIPDQAVAERRRQALAALDDAENHLVAQHAEPRREAFRAWLETTRPKARRWEPVAPVSAVSEGNATMRVLPDRSVLVSGDKPNQDRYAVALEPRTRRVAAVRLEVLPDESLPEGGPGRAPLFSNGDFLLSEFRLEIERNQPAPRSEPESQPETQPGQGGARTNDESRSPSPSQSPARTPVPVPVAAAAESFAQPGRSAALALDGKLDTGWSVAGGIGKPHAAVFVLENPVELQDGERLVVHLDQIYIHQMTIGRFRLSVAAEAPPAPAAVTGLPADLEAALVESDPDPAAPLEPALEAALLRHFLLEIDPGTAKPREALAAARRAVPKFQTTLVMEERDPEHRRVTRLRHRGEFSSPREPVEPALPAVLHPLPSDARPDRLGLARWLVDPANPLTPRVIVNQFWEARFGRGLVRTIEDFGTRGEPPTHPELLDWLAVEFRDSGWSVKRLHRLLATSRTYRQSSRVTPELLARDPENALLARGPRHRVPAETVRDVALAVSGLLNREIGGPPVYPPQPEGVTAFAYGNAPWPTSQGKDRYRRGLYTFLKRTAPYAAFSTFDMPTSEATCVRRERSNTPLQALTLLNDAAFVEAARALARVVIESAHGHDDDARVRNLFRRVLARLPEDAELARARAFLQQWTANLADPARADEVRAMIADQSPPNLDIPPHEFAAWFLLARAVLNLDETVTLQ